MTALKRVAILMGGFSAEREVSLVSGAAVLKAVEQLGHQPIAVDVTRNLREILDHLDPKPDVVLNLLHGRWGEDGRFQAILDLLEIPYAYSGVLASSLAMNKVMAKKVFRAEGIPTPESLVVSQEKAFTTQVMDFSYVLKPINEGSSVGVSILHNEQDLKSLDASWTYGHEVLVERFIPGREIHVAIMGNQALGAIEIRPKQGFYTYEAKYTEGKAEHYMPAPLPGACYQEALDVSLKAHQALGCKGISRVDLRYDDTNGTPGKFYVLEVNTQPGMTPLSLVPEIAAYKELSFNDLVSWMIENAQCDA
ncbi:MAG: D-alanine--D-alanine ligase [Alphaproteobacteria bacterium]|nr:D-alanine--D-alanine ligase [Alphaproteobacteria bacterium]